MNIRVVPYGFGTGTWYVYDLAGDDLVLDGTVAAAVLATPTSTTITSHTPNPSTAGQSVAFNVSVSGGVPDRRIRHARRRQQQQRHRR